MDGHIDHYTKLTMLEKERQIPCSITYMWNLKYDTNEHVYETDSQREQTCGCPGRQVGEKME